MNLAEIQHAIEALPPDQQASLAKWLADRDRERWDSELERDFSSGGDGMELLERVKAKIRRGESKPLNQDLFPQ